MSILRIEDDASLRTLTLNRPERRNALNHELMETLVLALRDAEPAGARAILLRAEGDAFCAGMDIAMLQASLDNTDEQNRIDATRIAQMFRALWDCDLPTVACVRGPALAGGTGIATLCDFTLAAPDAKFGFTEARIGFVPALVSAYLGLQLGDKAARDLLLSARIFSADEAFRLGLINEIVPSHHLDHRAAELTADLLRNSPASLRATKRMLRAQQQPRLDTSLAIALEVNAASRQTADFREGLSAFLEKRPPNWQ